MPRPPRSAAPPADDSQNETVQIAPKTIVGTRTPCAARPAQVVERSAARPAAHTGFYTFAYYNIGWQSGSKRLHHTKENLAAEICDLVRAKCVDAVGISEVFPTQQCCTNLIEPNTGTQPSPEVSAGELTSDAQPASPPGLPRLATPPVSPTESRSGSESTPVTAKSSGQESTKASSSSSHPYSQSPQHEQSTTTATQVSPEILAEVINSAAQPASPTGAQPHFFDPLGILHRKDAEAGVADAAVAQASAPVLPEELEELNLAMDSTPMMHTGYVDPRLLELEEASSLMVPSAATPRYSALLQKLNSAEDQQILQELAAFTVFDKLLDKKPYGSAEQPADEPYALAFRFEHLLRVTDEQRQLHIARLVSREDPRDLNANTLIFNEEDMIETLNEWRNNPASWCDKLQAITDLQTPQKQHQARKRRFSTMLFHLMGDKAMAEMFIKHPISGTEQPGPILRKFAVSWQTWRYSPARQAARQISERKEKSLKRLGHQKYLLHEKQKSAWEIHRRLMEDWDCWRLLSLEEKKLWRSFRNYEIWDAIKKVKMQQEQQHTLEIQILWTEEIKARWGVQCCTAW